MGKREKDNEEESLSSGEYEEVDDDYGGEHDDGIDADEEGLASDDEPFDPKQ
jgi:hypothetical protein